VPTASVMAIESEVFDSCVEEIVVSVGMENRGTWLCCGWEYLRFIWQEKRLKIGGGDGDGARYWRLIYWLIGVTEELKKPLR
jgi:hypothetical protein